MAHLDTVPKRGSSINFAMPWPNALPIPTGSGTQAKRQQGAQSYAGVLVASSAESGASIGSYVRRRRRRRS